MSAPSESSESNERRSEPLSGILRNPIDASEIESLEWPAGLDSIEPIGRWDQVIQLQQLSEACEARSPAHAALLRLLSAAISMHLVVNTPRPLRAALQLTDRRSPAPEDLSLNDVAALKVLACRARPAWLRARLSDVATVAGAMNKIQDWELAAVAARAYLESAGDSAGHDVERRESLQRAMELGWRYLRNDGAFRDRLWDTAMVLLRKGLAEASAGVSFPIAREIRKRNRSLAATAAECFEKQGRAECSASLSPGVAELFREAAELWHAAGETARSRAARHLEAETLIALARSEASAVLQADWMAEGIAVLRRNQGDRSQIRELQAELSDIRSRVSGEMGVISHPIDVSEIVAFVESHVTADNFLDALLQVAFAFWEWTKPGEARERVIKLANEFVLTSMFRQVTYGSNGVPVDVTAPFDASNDDELEKRVVQHVAQFEHPLLARVAIPRAIDILQTRFEPTLEEVVDLLHASPFTPRGHEWSLARGLLAGLDHDWQEAAVFLIPQAEPFVRAAFHRRGIHTLSHSSAIDGVEEERSLNELLAHPDVALVLPADIVLELKTLLTHKSGHNLRNLYGHGLIPDENLANPGTVTLWWTMLRLTLWPYRARIAELRAAREPATSQEVAGRAEKP